MKKSITLVMLALSASVSASAYAAPGDACTKLATKVARQTDAFVKINSAGPGVFRASQYTPEKALARLSEKNSALQATSDEVWVLRSKMTNLQCEQAKTFAY